MPRRRIRVGLNVLYFITGMGGIETFGRELVRAFRDHDEDDIEFVVFTSRDGAELQELQCAHIKVVVCPFYARFRGVRYLWEQFVLPWQALAYRLDLLHSLAYVGPVLSLVPTMLTVHDANARIVEMKALRRFVLWRVSLWAAHTARLVTTVSEFSRGELIKWYGLPESRIEVIASGPGTSLPIENAAVAADKIRELGAGAPYVAVIGGTYPHKNMPRLVQAFLRIEDRVPHRMVIVGKVPPEVERLLNTLDKNKILFTGYLPSNTMRAVISGSDLFVMPSLYEGFGFPVLEAQAHGVPVACSNAGALPEIAKGSTVLFDPENVEEIAATLVRCLTDRELNVKLRRLGPENTARYSWGSAAASYRECYRRLAGVYASSTDNGI